MFARNPVGPALAGRAIFLPYTSSESCDVLPAKAGPTDVLQPDDYAMFDRRRGLTGERNAGALRSWYLAVAVLLAVGRHFNGDFSRNRANDAGISFGRCCHGSCCGFFPGDTRVLETTTQPEGEPEYQ